MAGVPSILNNNNNNNKNNNNKGTEKASCYEACSEKVIFLNFRR